MSKIDLIPLHFSFSYDYLIAAAIEKEAYLRRDESALHDRGITTERIDAFAAKRIDFIAIPSNMIEKNSNTKGFNTRNEKATELRIGIGEILSIAKNTFTVKGAEYKGFNIHNLSLYSSEELYTHSENVVIKANLNKVKMGLKGLTDEMIADITTMRNDLLPLISATPILEGNANALTATRRNAANDLYDEMNAMCQVATTFYQHRDKTKLANYVMYANAKKTVNRKGVVKGNKSATPKSAKTTATTQLQLKVVTGISLQFYYGITKGNAAGDSAVTISNNPKEFTHTTAADLGYDAEGGIIVLNIFNPNATESGFFIKIG